MLPETKDQKPIPYQALLDENQALSDEIQTLRDENQRLRERLTESEELKRAISEGDLDALIIPRPEGELIFTLNSADHAYRVLVETMNEGTATLGFDGTILYCNHRFAELLRMPLQDIVGKSIYRFIEPEDSTTFNALLEGKKDSGEVNLHAADGKYIPVYLSISSMQAEDSQNAWCIVVTDLTDITEHMKNEEALKKAYEEIQAQSEELQVSNEELQAQSDELQVQTEELQNAYQELSKSEERYRMLFTNMTEGFFLGESIFDKDGTPCDYRFLEVNPAFELQTGLKREELIGKTIREVLHNPSRLAIEKYGEAVLSGKSSHVEVFSEELDKYLDNYIFIPEKGKFAVIFSDITERKRVETALKKSEERYRILFSNMTESFALTEILYDKDNRPYDYCYLDINPAYERNLGVKREEILGRTMLEIFPNTTPTTIERFSEIALTGQSVQYEVFSQEANRYIDVYAFSPEKGKLALIFRDITARKKAEAKLKYTLENLDKLVKERTLELENAYNSLKESEKNLAEAQRLAHIGSWEWHIQTGELHWSDEVYRIFGRNPQEFGANYDAFLNSVHPDDREYVNIAVLEALKNVKPYNIDHRVRWANGEERIVHENGEVVFDEKNIPIRMIGTVQDITERKQAEDELKRTSEELKKRNQEIISERQRLYNVLETLPVAIVLLTPDHHISFANRVFRDMFGELDSRHCYDFCFGLSKPCEFCEAFKVLETGKPHYWEATMPDGRILDVYDLPFTDIDGSLRVLEMDIDITERRQAEEALAKMEHIRIKEIHHRIKNNLQVISSLLDLQSETFSNHDLCKVPEVLEAFNESKNRVISMALIHEELYKGDSIDTLNFAAYLKKLTDDLFSSYDLGENSNISLELNLDQVYLNMDTAIPLGIIVNEIVTNSFKHAFPEGRKGEIQINLQKAETSAAKNNISIPDEDCIENNSFDYILKVSDNGKGIPKNIDFENLESLGLQLVNILVEQIDGCLEIKNENGTEFTIWFNNIEA